MAGRTDVARGLAASVAVVALVAACSSSNTASPTHAVVVTTPAPIAVRSAGPPSPLLTSAAPTSPVSPAALTFGSPLMTHMPTMTGSTRPTATTHAPASHETATRAASPSAQRLTSARTPSCNPSVAAATITISAFTFSPATLKVQPCQHVTVVNSDPVPHTVTADDGHSFDVSTPASSTGSFTAPSKAGSYSYHCTVHPFMVHATLQVA